MDTMPPLELVHQAIAALYRQPDPAGKKNASKWLQQLQTSLFGWKVADLLLHEKRDLESCYFAAQTMHSKIQRSFHELPLEAHQSLRDSLLAHLSCCTPQTNQIIVTQLCLSVANLALLMASWQRPVEELLERFGSCYPSRLLQLLTVLPEEIGSRYLRLGANRRDQMTQYCCSVCPLVVKYLCSLVASSSSSSSSSSGGGGGSGGGGDTASQRSLLKCLASWLTLPADCLAQLADSQLMQLTFHTLSNHQSEEAVHEAATECVCAALVLVENDARYRQLAAAVFAATLSLVDAYRLCLAAEMTDKCRNLSRLFTELGETVVSVLVHSADQAPGYTHVLDILLMCAGHHDYEVAEVTFHFWYRLSEELWHLRNEEHSALFRPYFERLILVLCRHCQMDSDHDGTVDDQCNLADFRDQVADLIHDFVFVCDPLAVFSQMAACLQQSPPGGSAAAAAGGGGAGGGGATSASVGWEVHEAALFIMTVVVGNLRSESRESEGVVCGVVAAALELPASCHLSLRHTATRLLGALASWFSFQHQLLEPVLGFVMSSLSEPRLAGVAALALKQLCCRCSHHLCRQLPQLVQAVQMLTTVELSSEAAAGVIEGVAKVVSHLPLADIGTVFDRLCQLHLLPLQSIISQPADFKPKKGLQTDPVLYLDRLAMLYKFTQPVESINGQAHPCKDAIDQAWPVLSAVASRFSDDGRVVERCCRCLRFATRCLRAQISHLVPALCQFIVQTYLLRQHSCLIYLGSVLVDECGALDTCSGVLLQLLDQLWPTAAVVLATSSGGGGGSGSGAICDDALRNNPETVDDLFRLCTRLLQRATRQLLEHTHLQHVIPLAVSAIALDHRDASSSVVRFLSEVLQRGRPAAAPHSQLVARYLQLVGAQLVANVVRAAVFCVTSCQLSDLAELLTHALLIDRQSVCCWLEHILKSLAGENTAGVVTVTPEQMMHFHQSVASSDKSQDVTRALKEFSRLYR